MSEPAVVPAPPIPARARSPPSIILAAGEGTRMKSARSKLLHEVAGQSLLSYAVAPRPHDPARADRGRHRSPARAGRGPPGRDRAARHDRGPGSAATAPGMRCSAPWPRWAISAVRWWSPMGDVPMLSGGDAGGLLGDAPRAGRRRSRVLTARGARPDGIRADPAGCRRTWSRRSSSTRTPTPTQLAHHRDQLRHLRLRRRHCCGPVWPR